MPPENTNNTPQVVMLHLDEIVFSDLNPRKTFKGIEEFADNIRMDGGVHTPITVRPFPYGSSDTVRYLLVMGERRCRASKLAGFETIPAIIRTDIDDTSHILLALSENLNRSNLSPIDLACSIRELMDRNPSWNQEDTGKKVGISQEGISKYLRLLKMSDFAQEAVNSGVLPVSTAIELCRLLEWPDEFDTAVKNAISDNWTQSWAATYARTTRERMDAKEKAAQGPTLMDIMAPDEETEPEPEAEGPLPLTGKSSMDYSAPNKTEPQIKPTPNLYLTPVAPGGKWHICDANHKRWLPDQQGSGFDRITEAKAWAKSWGQEPRLITSFAEGDLDAAWAKRGEDHEKAYGAPPHDASAGPIQPIPQAATIAVSDYFPATPSPKALSALPADIEEWLSEEALTPEQAIRQLMRMKPYAISPMSRRLADAIYEALPRGDDPKPTTVAGAVDFCVADMAQQMGVTIEGVE